MSTPSRQINLRYHVRVPARCKAVITMDGTESEPAEADIRNISRAGVMLSCSPALAERLVAGRKVQGQHEPLTVEMTFDFRELIAETSFEPPSKAKMLFTIAAVFAHANRRSREEYHVGLSYLRLTTEQEDLLDAFIKFRQLKRPAVEPPAEPS